MSPLLEQAINEIEKLSDEEQTAIAKLILKHLHQPISREDLLKLPLAQRQEILAQQAQAMLAHYHQNPEILQWSGGDVVEYEDAMS
ncbi:MAG: hypothetical protein HC799_12345 [Limnothrix sp. RL_2_0]|nr:hypothetical protein [Limnothrix sp. RL_2_0]